MILGGSQKIGRNDPCPCGSGKKYKRCCLEQRAKAHTVWPEQRDESDELTRMMIAYARDVFADFVEDAWEDFHLGQVSRSFSWTADEQMIFMPYFLFHWDPETVGRRKRKLPDGGVIAQSFSYTNGRRLTELQRRILEQAMSRPVSFYQVVTSKPGESFQLADVLTGAQAEVREHTASRQAAPGDLLYGSLWTLPDSVVLGYSAPIKIPLSWKVEVIGLRKMLRRRIAKQKRPLNAEDLLRYADEIRATYLLVRDSFDKRPRLSNTDGDSLVFHTLTFHIESPQAAFDALAPLAAGRSEQELLREAEFDEAGSLLGVSLDWLKKDNSKISSWDNTILGSIKISGRSLVAEVNSKNRAERLRAEIAERLGAGATHERTHIQTVDEMLLKASEQNRKPGKIDEDTVDDILRDPEIRKQIQEKVQKQVEAWAHEKIPALGGRTPVEAVRDPDGREMVEALLLDWERRTEEGAYQPGIRPDFNSVRKILKLMPS
jgi:hypothetical protein